MWSFPGSYANRGSGTQQASSDVVVPVVGLEPSANNPRLCGPFCGTQELNQALQHTQFSFYFLCLSGFYQLLHRFCHSRTNVLPISGEAVNTGRF